MINKGYIVFAFFIIPLLSFSQEGKEWEKNEGNVETLIYDVVGNKEIKLNQANRFFDPIPPQPVNRVDTDLEYSFNNVFYSGNPATVKLRPRPVAAQQEEKLYEGYAKAGFGNYMRPYLSAGIANKREKEFSYGGNFLYDHSYRGAVDQTNSGEGQLGARAFGDVYGDKITLYSDLSFLRNTWHFYGYPETETKTKEEIAQHFNKVNFLVGARNTSNKSDFRYNAKLGLLNQSDYFKAKETRIYTDIKTSLEVISDIWVEVDGQYNHLSRKDISSGNGRNYLFVKGQGRYKTDKVNVYGGLRFDINPDSLAGSKGFHLYPQAGVDFNALDNLTVYANLGGGMMLNSWTSFTDQNPFLNHDQYVANTNNRISLGAGVKANLLNMFSVKAGLHYDEYTNAAFFVNDPTDGSRFNVVYDTGEVVLFNPFVDIKFSKNEKYRAGVRAEYFGYQTDKVMEAYHKPTYRVGLFTGLNFGDKVYFDFKTSLIGGIKYDDAGKIGNLDPVLDLGMDVEYFFNKRLSAFLELGNMVSQNYQLYFNYPVKGFRALGGATFRF